MIVGALGDVVFSVSSRTLKTISNFVWSGSAPVSYTHLREQKTSVSTPVVAESGVPFVVGTAPVHSAESPAALFTPVLCTDWEDAVKKLGYSDDWKTYTICEVMYSHFKLFQRQPIIFCNVLDPSTNKEAVAGAEVTQMCIRDRTAI